MMVERIDFSQVPKERGYDSAFESDVDAKEKRQSFQGLLREKQKREKVANKRQLEEELIKEEGKVHRYHALAKDAYSRHKEYINNYLLYYGGKSSEFQRDSSKDRTDLDVIRENHQFLWDEDEDDSKKTWEKRLAKKYYDKLFKEYCIADLSHYKENKVGMRWRVDKEVVSGKGQFVCGNKKCFESEGLRSWEVNFGYVEHGEKKNALIKLRLCPDCTYKLNYHHKKKEVHPKKSKFSAKGSEGYQESHTKKKKNDIDPSEGASTSKSSEAEDKPDSNEGEGGESQEIWSKPVLLTEDKSRDDEFDDYFADMFL